MYPPYIRDKRTTRRNGFSTASTTSAQALIESLCPMNASRESRNASQRVVYTTDVRRRIANSTAFLGPRVALNVVRGARRCQAAPALARINRAIAPTSIQKNTMVGRGL